MSVIAGDHRSTFPSTNWLLINSGQAALGTLFARYRPALLAYLRKHPLVRNDEVEDRLQGFVTSRMLEKDLLGSADQRKGRFRSLLIKALDRYVVNVYRDARALKRSPRGQVNAPDAVAAMENVAEPAGCDVFDIEWARQVLNTTLERVKQHCGEVTREDVWLVMRDRLIGPILHGTEPSSYESLCQQMGITSPGQAANLLVTAKRLYVRTLRAVIAEYSENEADVDEEINDLMRVLAASRAAR